jgi:hypothetical protein
MFPAKGVAAFGHFVQKAIVEASDFIKNRNPAPPLSEAT